MTLFEMLANIFGSVVIIAGSYFAYKQLTSKNEFKGSQTLLKSENSKDERAFKVLQDQLNREIREKGDLAEKVDNLQLKMSVLERENAQLKQENISIREELVTLRNLITDKIKARKA